MTIETPKTDHKKTNSRAWLKWPVALLALTGVGGVLFLQSDFYAPKVGKGEPLTHAPKADIQILDNEPTEEISEDSVTAVVPETSPPVILDITEELQEETPEEIAAVEVESTPQLETAQLLQATLSLAKQHSEQQLVSAKFHTVMGLVLNQTLTEKEQKEWAKLALPLAKTLKAEGLVGALGGFAAKDATAEETTLPLWLAPLQGLVSVKRVGTEEKSAASIKDVRAAYQHYLMNERP